MWLFPMFQQKRETTFRYDSQHYHATKVWHPCFQFTWPYFLCDDIYWTKTPFFQKWYILKEKRAWSRVICIFQNPGSCDLGVHDFKKKWWFVCNVSFFYHWYVFSHSEVPVPPLSIWDAINAIAIACRSTLWLQLLIRSSHISIFCSGWICSSGRAPSEIYSYRQLWACEAVTLKLWCFQGKGQNCPLSLQVTTGPSIQKKVHILCIKNLHEHLWCIFFYLLFFYMLSSP